MLNELNEYFKLVSRYRTASPEIKGAIVRIAMPKLRDKTKSDKLKVAITKFIDENNGLTSVSGDAKGSA